MWYLVTRPIEPDDHPMSGVLGTYWDRSASAAIEQFRARYDGIYRNWTWHYVLDDAGNAAMFENACVLRIDPQDLIT